jgi:membrane protease YdiL (CAAX protease family)
MLAFLAPGIAGAVVLFAQHVNGVASLTRFPVYVSHHPVTNLVIGILAYLPVASIVPLALFLLSRTGQPPGALGIGTPSLRQDIIPALGLIAASYGCEFLLVIPLVALLQHHSTLINQTPVGHVPGYYIIWGLAIAAATSIAEEVLVNGYLMTRLSQLGWTPTSSLILSLTLRTSYHVYYGVGFILTIPLGYFVTRSFQKHGRLNRAIAAHFIFDAVSFTLGVFT